MWEGYHEIALAAVHCFGEHKFGRNDNDLSSPFEPSNCPREASDVRARHFCQVNGSLLVL